MIAKGSMAIIVEALANAKFEAYCNSFYETLDTSLVKAFTGERISQERAERIVGKFCMNMRGRKPC